MAQPSGTIRERKGGTASSPGMRSASAAILVAAELGVGDDLPLAPRQRLHRVPAHERCQLVLCEWAAAPERERQPRHVRLRRKHARDELEERSLAKDRLDESVHRGCREGLTEDRLDEEVD